MLKLSDFFDVKPLFEQCENYLKATECVSDARKLLLADKYPVNFKNEIMEKFKMGDKLKELIAHEEYQKISDSMKIELLDQFGIH